MTFARTNDLLADADVWHFLVTLTRGEAVPVDDEEAPPWFESGVNSEVHEAMYFCFLELLPPHWLQGSLFIFGENGGPFRLFWRRGGKTFGREMTDQEIDRFSQLSRTPLHQ